MAKERRRWGQIALESGWTITEWSADLLTVGQVYDWARAISEERKEHEKKLKKLNRKS